MWSLLKHIYIYTSYFYGSPGFEIQIMVFSGKTQLTTKYIVSGADINGNRATDVKRRVWLALPQEACR